MVKPTPTTSVLPRPPAPPSNLLPKPPTAPTNLPGNHQKPPVHGPHDHQRPPAVPQRVDFNFHAKYTNSLPDLPYPGKFLKCNRRTLKERFSNYHNTQLEMTGVGAKRLNMSEIDPATSIDLQDPLNYYIDRSVKVDPKDARLLEDESKEFLERSRRSQQHAVAVPFMRRTEYISSDFNRFGTGADRQEIKVGYNLMRKGNNEEIFLYRDKDSQIAAIEKTFEDIKKPVTEHHNKKGVYAVEEFPVYPDFQIWGYHFSQVLFDTTPNCAGIPEELQSTAIRQSRLMAVNNEQQTLGLFTPDIETLQQLLEAEEKKIEEQEYRLQMSKEYKYTIRNKANRNVDDDYFFHSRDGHFYYRDLTATVKLMRKIVLQGEKKQPCTLEIIERAPTEEEEEERIERENYLINPYVMDREEDGDDQEEGGSQAAGSQNGDSGSESSSSSSSSSTSSDTD